MMKSEFSMEQMAINAIFNCFGEKDQIFLTTNPTFGSILLVQKSEE